MFQPIRNGYFLLISSIRLSIKLLRKLIKRIFKHKNFPCFTAMFSKIVMFGQWTKLNSIKRRKTKFLEWNDDLVQCTKFQRKIRHLIYLQLYTIKRDFMRKSKIFQYRGTWWSTDIGFDPLRISGLMYHIWIQNITA